MLSWIRNYLLKNGETLDEWFWVILFTVLAYTIVVIELI